MLCEKSDNVLFHFTKKKVWNNFLLKVCKMFCCYKNEWHTSLLYVSCVSLVRTFYDNDINVICLSEIKRKNFYETLWRCWIMLCVFLETKTSLRRILLIINAWASVFVLILFISCSSLQYVESFLLKSQRDFEYFLIKSLAEMWKTWLSNKISSITCVHAGKEYLVY